MVDKDEHSNQLVVNEISVDAPVEDVWEALATEAGREAWLEPDPKREIRVDSEQPPDAEEGRSGRIAWWWWRQDEAPRHVELWVVAVPDGTRVIAIESAPAMPLPLLAASLRSVAPVASAVASA
jgi:uncharacterized protein YndB with AHSA1/START domain